MMGPFGKLPVELIVAIVDAMLALPVNVGRDLRAIATECAEAVRSFATACKVTRAVLTPTHIREARARLRCCFAAGSDQIEEAMERMARFVAQTKKG